ncbi:hypothetical protein PIB30_058566 [Stylosanthes scabra]|uniref:Uncharacterized protein n=1 Tax=Stylosanthes scabra TaxID=79078 RepID=A0ABU6ZIR8_9FABA|nr:hypothetical protein [Stylosanthes scabra]
MWRKKHHQILQKLRFVIPLEKPKNSLGFKEEIQVYEIPSHGSTARTPISAWETFPSRIMVLLSTYEGSMQTLSIVIQKGAANSFSGFIILNLLKNQVAKNTC